MSLDIAQIAEAFCSWRFTATYPYMADEIQWNSMGREELKGREAVIDRCDQSAKFLESVSATLTKLKINPAETFVVVEAAAQFRDQEHQTSGVTSCDIFSFQMGNSLRLHPTLST